MAILRGNHANNTIWAPAGNNTIYGYGGNDVLGGNNNSDVIYGGDGNDTLYPGDDSAPDTMYGGRGNDVYYANGPEDTIIEFAGQGIDTVVAKYSWTLGDNVENVTLQEKGASANGSITGNGLNNALTGNSGNNVVNGGAGNDTLAGGAGNDHLDGGTGNDRLLGGAGDDLLMYYSGNDTMIGGGGRDIFMVNGVTTPGCTVTVDDFQLGEDRLYRTDYLSISSVTAVNGGRDTRFVYEDFLHDPGGAPPVSVVLAGVTMGEIQDYLAPINGGTSYAPLFIDRRDVPW